DEAGRKRAGDAVGISGVAHQKTPPACWGERHCNLQFGIIAAAGARIGFSPAMVEHVFAARVTLEIARRSRDQSAVSSVREHMPRLPAGTPTDRLGLLHSRQEAVR